MSYKTFKTKLLELIRSFRDFYGWSTRGFLENSPQYVKERIFLKYGIPDALWIETGTYLGTTTNFLERRFNKVITIEPSEVLYEMAKLRFRSRSVEIYNGVSEDVFPKILPGLSGDVNFWLDGHYSAGRTFKGKKDCPVVEELDAIENYLSNFKNVSILIDDVRCFLGFDPSYDDYPTLDYLVDWARKNGFKWRIEQDVFLMRNHPWK